MSAIPYYIIKVVLCSGILYGYYLLALHNRIFHRWNRFFLLGIIPVSLIFPLVKINLVHDPASNISSQVIKLLNVVSAGEETIIHIPANTHTYISGYNIILAVYVLVTLILLLRFINMLYGLTRIIRKSAARHIQGIRLINTEVKGTPFSFFNNIFWDHKKIDIESTTGQQIFKHELAHVKEKHSADKLFINIALIFFWCNPFFWLIRRELNLIHEFIADHKAVEDSDTGALAAMILQAAYPGHKLSITNSFFSSSIKRRVSLLTKMRNSKVNYIGRILVLPLLTFLFTAFATKIKHTVATKEAANTEAILEKPVAVVTGPVDNEQNTRAEASGSSFEKNIPKSNTREKEGSKVFFINKTPVEKIFSVISASRNPADTTRRKIKSIDLTTDNMVIVIYRNNTAVKVTREEASKMGVVLPPAKDIFASRPSVDSALFIIDGTELPGGIQPNLPAPGQIDSINVLKGEDAINVYGEKGRNGVMQITTKRGEHIDTLQITDEK